MTWPESVLDAHHTGILFDGHNDLPWAMRQKASSSFDKVDISKPTEFHTDIPRLRKGGVKAQFWSVYVPASTDFTGNALIQTLEQIRLVKEMCRRYPDDFAMADTADDILRIAGEGKVASMIGVEGGHSIQNSLQALRQLYAEGARYMTLTHSKTLAWADSCTDEPINNGLSPFGEEVVREMNRLGMLVDLSHVSPKCMKDALEVAQAPVMFSHSSARNICDHVRNVPDDILKLTAENGGVVMVTFVSAFVIAKKNDNDDSQPFGSVKNVVDHIEHVINIAGIDHVGIGSDFDGVTRLPVGLKDVSQYPNITEELMNRGYTKSDVHKILGGNVIRVLREAEKVATRLKAGGGDSDDWTGQKIVVENGDTQRGPSIVHCKVGDLPDASNVVTLASSNGSRVIGQIASPGLCQTIESDRILTFVVPEMKPNEKLEFQILPEGLNAHRQFDWHDDGSTQAELQFGDLSVLKYMYEEVDDSSKARRQETYKPYHHVFSPDGATVLTKGPGGLFEHHRGIFFGYNRISYEGKKADTWHCRNGESQVHLQNLERVSGPVFARERNLIAWNGQDGKPFAREFRQLTCYKINGKTMIQFDSKLESLGAEITLRGDPQHAGVQFRATQAVPEKTKDKTYYIRPDGKDKPGNFRNWSGKKDEKPVNQKHVNLPWHGMSFFVGADQYTVCNIGHPENPKPSRFSERDYGRFGSYFEYDLAPEKPLLVRNRFWIQDGEMDVADAESLALDVIAPLESQTDEH